MNDLFEEARKEASTAVRRSTFGRAHVACLTVLTFVTCVDFDTTRASVDGVVVATVVAFMLIVPLFVVIALAAHWLLMPDTGSR